jgi:heme-degrading monooxygenase HmoA
MVTIGMNYYVIPGKESVFEAAVANVVDTMNETDGHEKSHLYKEVGDEDPAYLIVSRWADEVAFNAFVASDAFKKVTNWGKENILSRRPSHTTYQED